MDTKGIWTKIITSIHGQHGGLGSYGANQKRNGVWSSILKAIDQMHTKNIIPISTMRKRIGNGTSTRYWMDMWVGNLSLNDRFLRVFALEMVKDCMVSDRWNEDKWNWSWNRTMPIVGRTSQKFIELQTRFRIWNCMNGFFSVSSARNHIDIIMLHTGDRPTSWKNCVPIKVNILGWRINLDRLPTRKNLVKKGIDLSSLLCPMCGDHIEDVSHVFVRCEVACHTWEQIFTWLDIYTPIFVLINDIMDWVDSVQLSHSWRKILKAIMLTTMRVIRKFRNNKWLMRLSGVRLEVNFQPNNQMIVYQGDAFASSGIQVTKNQRDKSLKNSVGRALYYEPVQIWDKKTRKMTDFVTHFMFSINALNATNFGDGLSFFLMPFEPEIPNGSFGRYLGLFSPASAFKSSNNTLVAVEFDSFKNSWDPSDNHVGINVNSIISVANISWNTSIKDGRIVNAWHTYFNGNASIWHIVDLREVLPESVRVGFSAGTGDWIETHTVFSWTFSSNLGKTDVKKKMWLATGLATGRRSILTKKQYVDMEYDFEISMGPKKFSFRELSKATDGFSENRKLGQGGFGGVYKGVLRGINVNSVVTVKRVSSGSNQGKKEYVSEVKTISRLRHKNLVQLMGWCHEQGDFLLVYEFMPNGSLDSHLFYSKSKLCSATRYKIAMDIASALLYLHEEWEHCVVHRDIKSSNIMLDSSYNANLGDFGLARFVDHDLGSQTTVLAGTMAYMAPEYVMTGKASRESDVYSFGVVALEIACGRKPIDTKVEPSKQRLVEWVWSLYGEGKILVAVDKRLNGEFDKREMECLMVVGLRCCNPDSNDRPSIKQAISVLNFEGPLSSSRLNNPCLCIMHL
ncbi:Concanavalin A-like lectin/glucanase superfamily [Artemisia annua]|uniref:non-specific serine/threonine protein kinase n=1 Tax=Artemisia annua TaxID=35608 RepID=A0A2U1NCI1_ARTAN|nr:Concanavalin A-like lectin/glucanase superfamily [Artemisia annua]